MSYLFIAERLHTLPFAIPVNEESIPLALGKMESEIADLSFKIHFLIDQEAGAIYRIYKDSNGDLQVSPEEDSIKELGSETNYHYFEGTQEIDAGKPETAEMIE
jgi:hypothetical protein